MDRSSRPSKEPAPRAPATRGPRCGDDAAVSEVIGYILMFALSAVILTASLQAFTITQERSDKLSAGVEMQGVANRVASRILQASLVAEEMPNATFHATMRLPDVLGTHTYYVQAHPSTVYVNATNEQVRTNSTTFRTEAISGLGVSGKVFSSDRLLRVEYTNSGGTQEITITQG